LDVLETDVDDVGLLLLELLEVDVWKEEFDIVLTKLLVAVICVELTVEVVLKLGLDRLELNELELVDEEEELEELEEATTGGQY
jgi:hypothetical protein